MPSSSIIRKNNQPTTKNDLKTLKSELKAEIVNVGHDVDKLAIATKNTFDRVEGKIATIEKNMATKDDLAKLDNKVDGIANGQKAMLGILDENNQLLKEIRRLPERVARLKRSVFRH